MTPPMKFPTRFFSSRRFTVRALSASLLAVACATALGLATPAAEGDEKSEAKAAEALATAVKQGQALYRKSWKKGAKGCFACHTRGPNKLTGRRLKSYPKYDKSLRKVVTAQEKINSMIKKKSGGKQLDLGHAELTALEAYISTLK